MLKVQTGNGTIYLLWLEEVKICSWFEFFPPEGKFAETQMKLSRRRKQSNTEQLVG